MLNVARGSQARSQDFVQEGANLARAKVPTTKNQKLLGFGPLFSRKPSNFIFFAMIFVLFYYTRHGGETRSNSLGCVPAGGRINAREIHYRMIPALNTPY